MSTHRTCSTCQYFVHHGTDPTAKKGAPIVGECRRNPPTLVFIPNPNSLTGAGPAQIPASMFAPTSEKLWCGQWAEGAPTDLSADEKIARTGPTLVQ